MLPVIGIAINCGQKATVSNVPLFSSSSPIYKQQYQSSSECYPSSLLTDLKDLWNSSWFIDESVVAHVTLRYPKNAIGEAVSEREGSVSFRVPFIAQLLKMGDDLMERFKLIADLEQETVICSVCALLQRNWQPFLSNRSR
eukprot:Gregarina_sp_Poly_1__2285@NODE_1607_length_3725_cov_62_124385_g1059_i0_p4_GENE_NODE_1607_length_3725_cov_62_124385_g1059_i0NODE_1607_length_3725_cov_62_124385_g1059_i0_p4_ORF_typecomplete_len141_score12_80_NODE_1607_length_3725_cov_62_124385_g1059_i08891311